MIVNLSRWDSLSSDSRLGSFHVTLTEQPFAAGEAPDLVMGWAYNMNAQGGRQKPDEPGIGVFLEGHFAERNGLIFQEFQVRATGTDDIQHRPISVRARLQNGNLASNEIDILIGLECNALLFKDPIDLVTYAELNRSGLSIEPLGASPGIKIYQNGNNNGLSIAPRSPGVIYMNDASWLCVALPGINAFQGNTELKRPVRFDHTPNIATGSIELAGNTLSAIDGQLYWNGRLVVLA